MKVVAGLDGSAGSGRAVALLASLPWPDGSVVRLVAVLDTGHLLGPWSPLVAVDVGGAVADARAVLRATVEAAAAHLAAVGLEVETSLPEGRPSTVVLDEARDLGADLIVVGSRGRGAIRTMLLGSVSAEIVDRATCPVLVVRRPTLGTILLAQDGSPYARAAEDIVAFSPPFADAPVEVLSVARDAASTIGSLSRAHDGTNAARAHDSNEASRQHHEDVCRWAVERLAGGGRSASAEVRFGDPGAVLVDEAEARGVGLVAMGTHGRTGLERLRLGSVARNVLTHAPCSVLVVPPRSRARR